MEVQRVQVIASLAAAADVIPAEFIRTKDEQPGATTFRGPTPEVPVVDLQDADEARLASLAADAAAQWGIFQVVNHGIPAAVVEELKRVGREFFELPQEEKERYAMTAPPGSGGSFEGYGSTLHKEAAEGTKKPWADFLFHTIHPPSRIDYRFWPTTPSSYRSANEEYGKYMVDTVRRILRLLSKGSGLEDESTLYEALGGDGMEMLMKINYYPPCPRPDLALGVPQHTDMSVLTLLVPNDVQGLQVFKDDRWFDVDYIPHALIIHIGDQVEIATNGKYKSVLHRTTVNKEKTRMSWPVFCSPPGEAVIGPLPHFVTGDNPERFKAKKYKDYAYCKINKLPQ